MPALRTSTAVLFLAATVALAQVEAAAPPAPPFRFVPEDAAVVLRVSGPAAWKRQFAATDYGKAIAAVDWDDAIAWVDRFLAAELADVEGADALRKELQQALLGYGGEAVLAIRVAQVDAAAAIAKGAVPRYAIALALGPDGATDLGALAERIATFAAERLLRVREEEVAGEPLRLAPVGDSAWALPVLRDGSLVTLFGNALEADAGRFLGDATPRYRPPAEATHGAFWLRLECEKATPTLLRYAKHDLETHRKGFGAAAIDALELDCVRDATFACFADGARFALDIDVLFRGKPRGLFAVLTPPRTAKPRLVAYVPAGVQSFSVLPFDLQAALASLRRLLANDATPPNFRPDALEATFESLFKVRLVDDLLAHVGDEMLEVVDDVGGIDVEALADDDPTREKVRDRVEGKCLAIALRDPEAFAKSFEKALRARGLHAARRTTEYGEARIHQLTFLGIFPMEYTLAGELLAVGFGGGDGTRRLLRGILDRVADKAAGKPAPELPAAVRERLRELPADWNAIRVNDVVAALDGIAALQEALVAWYSGLEGLEGFDEAVSEAEGDIASFNLLAKTAADLRRELVRLGVSVDVGVAYYRADRWSFRSRL